MRTFSVTIRNPDRTVEEVLKQRMYGVLSQSPDRKTVTVRAVRFNVLPSGDLVLESPHGPSKALARGEWFSVDEVNNAE